MYYLEKYSSRSHLATHGRIYTHVNSARVSVWNGQCCLGVHVLPDTHLLDHC